MSISNCGHDERGKYSGGKAGDQTGGEYCVRSWYNRPWDCVLRHPDSKVQSDIAKLARQAAENDLVGYDQGQRSTFWEQLKAASSYLPANIKTACEADCSSSTAAIVKAVGYRKKDDKLKGVNPQLCTWDIRNAFKVAGFDVLTDSKYRTSQDYLLPGDILLNEAHHVAINLTKGSKVSPKKTGTTKLGVEFKVTAKSGLNYRRGAGTKYGVAGAYSYGEHVTITEQKTVDGMKWGKATNGYWSTMAYLKAV